MDDKAALLDHLLLWIGTFELTGDPISAEELSNGLILTQCLSQIVPDYFNKLYDQLRKDNLSSSRVRTSNINRVIDMVRLFYLEVRQQDMENFDWPEASAIGSRADPHHLVHLIQLILGIAVYSSDKREEFVGHIQQLDEAVQQAVMNVLTELTQFVGETDSADHQYADETDFPHHQQHEIENEHLRQQVHELREERNALRREQLLLKAREEKLSGQLHEMEQRQSNQSPSVALHGRLQKLQKEKTDLEVVRDELVESLREKEQDVHRLKEQNKQLLTVSSQLSALQDEVDESRALGKKVRDLENQIERYQRRLGELPEVKQRLASSEEQCSKQRRQIEDLERKLRDMSSSHNENYRQKVRDLEEEVSEERQKTDRAEFEMKRAQGKLEQRDREITKLQQELLDLQAQGWELNSSGAPSILDETGEENVQLRVRQLEEENEILRSQAASSDLEQQLTELQDELKHAGDTKQKLREQNRAQNLKILELETRLEEEASTESSAARTAQRREAQLAEMKRSLTELRLEMKVMEGNLEQRASDLKQTVIDRDRLKNDRDQLANELRSAKENTAAMEKKHRQYLEKAKNVIKALEAKQASPVEMQQLRQRLQAKEKLADSLEEKFTKLKEERDQEVHLVCNAWYQQCEQAQRLLSQSRLPFSASSNALHGLSFLSRQRQASQQRQISSSLFIGSSALGSSDPA